MAAEEPAGSTCSSSLEWLVAVTVTVIVTADATATAIAIALRTSRVEVVAPLDVEDEEGRGRVNMMIRGWRSACNVGARCAREAGVMGEMPAATVWPH